LDLRGCLFGGDRWDRTTDLRVMKPEHENKTQLNQALTFCYFFIMSCTTLHWVSPISQIVAKSLHPNILDFLKIYPPSKLF